MITNFNEYAKLNDYNLSTDNYSKYYYLVLKLNEDTLNNLVSGKLKDLKGISDSIKILNSYFDIRDLLLVMKKEEVESINDIEKVIYDDVEYLTKDNFSVLDRLYNGGKTKDIHIGSLLYQGIRKVFYFKHKESTNNNINKLYRKYNGKNWKILYDFDRTYVHKLNDIKKIKDYNDLLDKTFVIINKLDSRYTKEILDDILRLIILSFGDVFKHEGEILIKNKTFTIPKNSVLFIKEQHESSYIYSKNKDIIYTYLDKLKEKFSIKILPYKNDGSIISQTHKPAFAMIRYLDKMF